MADDLTTRHLIAELQANCAVMGAYGCGECLPCLAESELKRLLSLLEPIIKAFTVAGPVPEYHDYIKRRLKKDWPGLYKAIDNACKENHNADIRTIR